MITVDDLSPGRSLPGPIVVTVTDVEWDAGPSRRAEVALVDSQGNPLRLVDYEGARISIEWKPDSRYRISRCYVNKGGGGYDLELAPSKKTLIEPLDTTVEPTRLLVLGDTHIGRTRHPKTEVPINPVGAFATAVEHGIDQDVDAVVHTGDIFHDSATTVQTILAKQTIFEPLAEADIPFYYVRGNHGSEPSRKLLTDLEDDMFSTLDTSGVAVNRKVRLFGIDHHSGGRLPWNELRFPRSITEPVAILVLHQTLKQLSGRGTDRVDLDDLQQRCGGDFDFVFSGHHHDADETSWNGIPVRYTGAAERMSKKSEPIDRVAWILSVEDRGGSIERYDIP